MHQAGTARIMDNQCFGGSFFPGTESSTEEPIRRRTATII